MRTIKRRNTQRQASADPYHVLVNRILQGEYRPGTALLEQDIAAELSVSRTPVREALLRLKVEGLVKIVPRGGIFVAEASVKLIRDVTEVRLVLEECLVQLVIERHTATWLQESQAWLREVEAAWTRLSSRQWMQKDSEFHDLLDRAASNESLSQHLSLLRRQAVLFWGQSPPGPASLEGIIVDFKETFAAVQKKNVAQCTRVLHRHVLDHVAKIQESMRPAAVKVSAGWRG